MTAYWLNEEEEKRRRALYDQGYNDGEIAREVGVKPATIWSWRSKRGLPPNAGIGKGGGLDQEEEEKRLNLYNEGLNDREIAEAVGVTPASIYRWRSRRGLEANVEWGGSLDEERERKRRRLYEEGYSDVEIAKEEGISTNAIRDWRNRRDLPVKPHNHPSAAGKAGFEKKLERKWEEAKREMNEFFDGLNNKEENK